MEDDERPFIVFKFLNDDGTEPDEEEDVFYDVGLLKWIITDIDDKMIAKIKWPLFNPSAFVKKESKLNSDWSEEFIKVKRFYATYPDAANACKKYISDSNYETDKQLGRGMRKKRKPCHLDTESSDKESELENDLQLNSNIKRKKIVKKCLDNSNTSKKTFDKCKTQMKSLPSPPVPPLLSERFVLSPDKITRQHIPQLSKQPTFSLSVAKDSGRDHGNFAQKITLQNNQNEEKKRQVSEKLKQLKQDKYKFKETKKYNSEKESSSPTFIKTNLEKQEKADVEKLSNLVHTPSKNLFIDKRKSNSRDTQVTSPFVSGEVYTPTELHTYSPVYSNTSSQSASVNLIANQQHGESSNMPSTSEINDNQSISGEDEFISSNRGEVYLQVTEFPLLESVIHKRFSEIKKEISIFSSKMDICLMNQEKLNRFLLPGEKIIKKPPNFPSLPVDTKVQLNCLENFLKDDGNLSAAVLYCKPLKVNL